ncbi:MAG TPA: fumarylacetoacetate hydrolase family protein [Alphaproteobacteria bacterium]|nr:fumarylacetoacetate hydrolase family protein [Alphaproteobacteria bacterium]
MKLLRYGRAGQEKPGILDRHGKIRDLSAKVPDIAAAQLAPKVLDDLRRIDPESLPLVPGTPRIGPCVGAISKLVCVGLNYSDHAAETGAAVPAEPILFMKATSAICGPNDDVILPRGSKKSDWEVELGIVIGTKASYIPEERSLDYVAGYCVVNDVSEREFQMERLGQWTKGKSADTFAPIGPWMVSKDEIVDPQNLDLYLDVNGERRQRGNTRTMIFGVRQLVSYISQFMTLLPGDVIPTGTPPGVGLGMKPPVFLKSGDVMRLGISGLGEQNLRVVAASR